MTQPMMPFACDLDAAPLGSWAEYEESGPWIPIPFKTRFALVGKRPEGVTIEWTGFSSNNDDFVMAYVFTPGKGPPRELVKQVLQDGAYEPMESPPSAHRRQDFRGRLDTRSLVGTDEITVRVGTFRTKRYHYLTAFGENVDAWISATAWPICLVKLDAEQKQDPSTTGRFSYELVATGSDAKPRITRPAVPHNLEVLKKQDDEKRARTGRPDNAPRVGDTIVP